MSETVVAVQLQVDVPGGDAEDRQEAIEDLDRTLRESDEIVVERRLAAVPPGAKGAGLVEALVASAVSGALPVTVTLVLNWLERRRQQCTVTLDLGNGVSARITDLDSIDEVRSRLAALGQQLEP